MRLGRTSFYHDALSRCIDAVLCRWLHPLLPKKVPPWGWICRTWHPWQCCGCSWNERTKPFPEKTVAMFITHRSTTDILRYSNINGDTSSASWSNRRSAFMERTRKPSVKENRSQNWCASPVITSANPNSSPPVFHFSYWTPTLSMLPQRLCQPCQLHRESLARSVEESHSLHCGCHQAMRRWPSAGWAPVVQHWTSLALQLAMMAQKCHLGTAPQDICKKLNHTKYSHETRESQSCFTPFRTLTTSGSVCFSNRAPLIWNFLRR